LSVAHYGEQNGDLMRDPEMCFELGLAGGAHLNPFYFRSDRTQTEEWSRYVYDSDYIYLFDVHRQHERFAKQWNNNLRSQGFAEVFTDKCIRG
jgi:hypothetical protein